MGYTHYFPQSRSFKNDEWKTAKDGVKKIVEYCQKQGIALQHEYNISKKPSITSKVIRFNGVGEELGHETFYISKAITYQDWQDKTKPSFAFCKTARKPYDLAVCLSLLRIKEIAPDAIELSSDGDWDIEWVNSRLAYKELFGNEPPKIND
jgi:hypothetical protein